MQDKNPTKENKMRNVNSLNKDRSGSCDPRFNTMQNIVIYSPTDDQYRKIQIHIIECSRCDQPMINKNKTNSDSNRNMSLCPECLLDFVKTISDK